MEKSVRVCEVGGDFRPKNLRGSWSELIIFQIPRIRQNIYINIKYTWGANVHFLAFPLIVIYTKTPVGWKAANNALCSCPATPPRGEQRNTQSPPQKQDMQDIGCKHLSWSHPRLLITRSIFIRIFWCQLLNSGFSNKTFIKVAIEIRHHVASGQECLHDEVSDFLKNRAEIRCCLCLGHLISGLLIFL